MNHVWRTSSDPDELAAMLPTFSHRKALLLGMACLRRVAVWSFIDEPLNAMRTAELWADGLVGDQVVEAAYLAVFNRREAAGRMVLGDPDSDEPNIGTAIYYVVEAAITLLERSPPREVVRSTLAACRQSIRHGVSPGREESFRAESEAQCRLIREMFRNPFNIVAFDPSWRTEAVIGLARGMYESRNFGPMPVLADALEDAGCPDADVLGHCRGPGPHVRGCWVVDLALGKA